MAPDDKTNMLSPDTTNTLSDDSTDTLRDDNTSTLPDPTDFTSRPTVSEVATQALGFDFSILRLRDESLAGRPAKRRLVWNNLSLGAVTQERRQRRFIKSILVSGDEERMLAAVMIQLLGNQTAPCGHCRDNRGEWFGCVMPTAKIGYPGIIPCANCVARSLEATCDVSTRDSVKLVKPDEELKAIPISDIEARGLEKAEDRPAPSLRELIDMI